MEQVITDYVKFLADARDAVYRLGCDQATAKQLKEQGERQEKELAAAKNLYLYVTQEGSRVSKAHKMYDILDITKTMSQLQEKCSAEEIEAFYPVISVYN